LSRQVAVALAFWAAWYAAALATVIGVLSGLGTIPRFRSG
jgi:ACR3 family arsenite efflux pump ArsB